MCVSVLEQMHTSSMNYLLLLKVGPLLVVLDNEALCGLWVRHVEMDLCEEFGKLSEAIGETRCEVEGYGGGAVEGNQTHSPSLRAPTFLFQSFAQINT